jgi:hypothetical protein
MFLKTEYLFGSRPIEVAGELTSTDRINSGLTVPFGPKGTDVFLSETDAPDMQNTDFVKILVKVVTALALQTNMQAAITDINETIDNLTKKIPVAVFKVRIAKQHLDEGEDVPFRLVALPLVDEYEPWAREVYEYFKAAGNNYVFPFSRQDVWEYITRKDRIFEGLTYRIKKYVYSNKKPEVISLDQLKLENNGVLEKLLLVPANNLGVIVLQTERHEYKLEPSGKLTKKEAYTIFSHPKPLKNSGLRHIRTNELLTDYGFDGIDLAAMIGWSMRASQKVSASPAQTGTYAEVREMWRRYIKKLCKKNRNNGYQ